MAVGINLITRQAVDEALREFAALGRDAFLKKYKFRKALDYVVQDPVSGAWADSKAVVGAAFGFRFPERGPLTPTDFSGGQVQVVRLLRELGFSVRSLIELGSENPASDRDWSHAEVELVVADYLDMLALELAGQKYNKAERRRALMKLLNDRTDASIEFKRRNISSALLDLGYPAIRGYLPAPNRQKLLIDVLERQVGELHVLDELARSFTDQPAVVAPNTDYGGAQVSPPLVAPKDREVREPRAPTFRAVKRDYLEREARNSSLGKAGELFILGYQQWHLASMGLGQLADKVRHVSVEDGDGLGYDILSFGADGSERYLEVKTTALGELTPFFVTAGEVRFAVAESSKFAICRLFNFRSTPKFFELPGPVEKHCQLDPVSYKASLV